MENLDDYKVTDEYSDEFEEEGTQLMEKQYELTMSPKAKERGNYYANLEESEMLRQK